MARIKYSALVSDMRNKLNGSVLTKSRSGSTVRNKVTPANRNTNAQSATRTRLSQVAKYFRTLTDDQITAWNNAVESYKSTNIFGDIVRPSGINLFVKLNSNLLLAGQGIISDPPIPAAPPTVELRTVDIATANPKFALDFSVATVPAGHKLIITASKPVSAGVSNFKGNATIIEENATLAGYTCDIWNRYVAKYGVPAVDTKINVGFKLINTTTGQSFAGNDLASKVKTI